MPVPASEDMRKVYVLAEKALEFTKPLGEEAEQPHTKEKWIRIFEGRSLGDHLDQWLENTFLNVEAFVEALVDSESRHQRR